MAESEIKTPQRPVTALILMGGLNRRMGGRKKALLLYRDRHFYEYVCQALLKAGVTHIYASVEAKWDFPLQLPQIVDRYSEIGPLGGIVTALEMLKEEKGKDTPGLLVLPCDLPFMDAKLVEALLSAFTNTGCPVVLEAKGRLNPLIAIYTRDCLPVLQKQIAEKDFKAVRWTEQVAHSRLLFEELGLEEKVLANINDLNDYAHLE